MVWAGFPPADTNTQTHSHRCRAASGTLQPRVQALRCSASPALGHIQGAVHGAVEHGPASLHRLHTGGCGHNNKETSTDGTHTSATAAGASNKASQPAGSNTHACVQLQDSLSLVCNKHTHTPAGVLVPGTSTVLGGTVTPGGTWMTKPLEPGELAVPTLVLQGRKQTPAGTVHKG